MGFSTALVRLLHDCLNDLADRYIPRRNWWEITLRDGAWAGTETTRPDIYSLEPFLSDVLTRLPSYGQLVAALPDDMRLQSRTEASCGTSTHVERIVKDVVSALLTEPKLVVLAPLESVEVAASKVDLEPGVRLRTLEPEDLERWFNGPSALMASFVDCIRCKACVEASGDQYDTVLAQIDRALTALTLATGKGIEPPPFFEYLDRRPVSLGLRSYTKPGVQRGSLGESIRVEDDVADLLKEVWLALGNRGSRSRIALALSRWDSAMSRSMLEDRLIDLWIALESLLLGSGSVELRYRVALRAAALVDDSKISRSDIYKQLQKSYDCRSKVVHGKKAPEDLGQHVDRTTNILRNILLKILRHGKTLDPDVLEHALLDQSASSLLDAEPQD